MPEKQSDCVSESCPLLWALLWLRFLRKFTLTLRRTRLQCGGREKDVYIGESELSL